MTLVVELPALMMTVQDQGRFGYQRFGMPESGPMDWWAFGAANALVGNNATCACLEVGVSSAAVRIEMDAMMALCGVGYHLSVNGKALPLWMAFRARKGDLIKMEKIPGGSWVYLSVAGGFLSQVWMGSRSYYLRAGLGCPLDTGDHLAFSPQAGRDSWRAGNTIPEKFRPGYHEHPQLRVVLGLHQSRFPPESFQTFLDEAYELSNQSDRMGYRLDGPKINHLNGADLVSQGMALGEIQVPADGQPIVMMPDHPTTGGYTCIGTVASVDMPLLAQAQPGVSRLRFSRIEVAEARAALINVSQQLETAVKKEEEPWLNL